MDAYVAKTYDDVLQEILTDYQNQIPGCDISEGSDIYIKAVALASAVWGLYSRQDYIKQQIFPDTSDSGNLQLHAGDYKINPLPPNAASGTVTFTGDESTAIPSGTKAVDENANEVITTADGVITGGTANVATQATVPGVGGNLAAGTALTLEPPIDGLDSAATVADDGSGNGFTGGTDVESDDALLAQVLDRMQNPPAGGNSPDYETWAKQVPGVAWAKCYPARPGLGYVTVVILTSGTGADRIPSPDLVTAVWNYIDPLRPANDKYVTILAPTALAEDVSVRISVMPCPIQGMSQDNYVAQVKANVSAAVTAYYAAFLPMQVAYISQLRAIIANVDGVMDSILDTPAANVVPTDDGALVIQMITPGGVTVNDL